MKSKTLLAFALAFSFLLWAPAGDASSLEAKQITAYWTGKSKSVRTVTGKYVWECEYSYYANGRRNLTYKLFETSCASSIDLY